MENLKESDHLENKLRWKNNNKILQSNYIEGRGLDSSSSRKRQVFVPSAQGNEAFGFHKM